MVALGVSNLCFMLPWQFAQFVLLTQVNPDHAAPLALTRSAPQVSPVAFFLLQVASLFASYILGYLAATKMQTILVTHMVRSNRDLSHSEVELGLSCCCRDGSCQPRPSGGISYRLIVHSNMFIPRTFCYLSLMWIS